MARSHRGTECSTWMIVAAPKEPSRNGNTVASPATSRNDGDPPRLASIFRIIATDRPSPAIGTPAAASGSAVRPVPQPISRHKPAPDSLAISRCRTRSRRGPVETD
jgi:hypothetical protein